MTARTADTVAQALHDERDPETGKLRDLASHEATFLTAYHRIGTECAQTKRAAILAWGDRTRAYDAVVFLANQKRDQHLRIALERYDAAASVMEDA